MTEPPAVHYQARCESCTDRSRRFLTYSSAETAAERHTEQTAHTTYVVDHYGLRVSGSTVRPGG